jgi:hypothetical protein
MFTYDNQNLSLKRYVNLYSENLSFININQLTHPQLIIKQS